MTVFESLRWFVGNLNALLLVVTASVAACLVRSLVVVPDSMASYLLIFTPSLLCINCIFVVFLLSLVGRFSSSIDET